ncbi:hypothetical protein E2C01_043256 [Portunus trituberculatus]|uniref:Uncharacterized protein n=1 Tax=Portunus trituberculatus TaxID=210409 RepID=A0A5B7FVU2_PORTR|nr:hypothetical protein [Portunus trituberculatus]
MAAGCGMAARGEGGRYTHTRGRHTPAALCPARCRSGHEASRAALTAREGVPPPRRQTCADASPDSRDLYLTERQ